MALVRTQLLNLFRNPFTKKKLEMEIEYPFPSFINYDVGKDERFLTHSVGKSLKKSHLTTLPGKIESIHECLLHSNKCFAAFIIKQ